MARALVFRASISVSHADETTGLCIAIFKIGVPIHFSFLTEKKVKQ
jgi:hypothetical protein